jgi:hypothetical protein
MVDSWFVMWPCKGCLWAAPAAARPVNHGLGYLIAGPRVLDLLHDHC